MYRGTRVLAGAFALVGAIGALSAAPAAAQSGFSLTPWAGAYVPTQNSFSTVGSDIRRDNSFIMGARLSSWGSGAVGFELTAGFAPARVHVSGTTINESRNTEVFVGGAKLLFGLSPRDSRLGFFLSAGPSIIRRGNDVTRESRSVTDWGGVAGLGMKIPFGGTLGLRLELEDYIYGGNFDGSRSFQNDLVLSAGLSIGW